MTLPLVGPFNGSEIRSELRQTGGNLVIPDATTRWLANEPTGPVDYPTDFFGKTAIKRVHTELITGGNASSFGTTASLGIDFPGRRLIVCVCCLGAAAASQITITSMTLGGAGLALGSGWAFWQNSVVNVSNGMAIAAPNGVAGTSATLTVNFNQNAKTLRVVVYSVANINNIFSFGSNASTTVTASTNVAIDTNGVVIAQGVYNGNGSGMAFGFVNEDTDILIGDNIKFGTGFINRLSPQASQSISVTGNGSAGAIVASTIAAMSFGS